MNLSGANCGGNWLDLCIVPSNCNYAAVAGRDFVSVSDQSVFGITEEPRCIDISIIDDSEQEQSESFSVTVAIIINIGSGITGRQDTRQISIIDNDG